MIIILLLIIAFAVIIWLMKQATHVGIQVGATQQANQTRLVYAETTGDLSVLTEQEQLYVVTKVKQLLLQNGWQTDGVQWWLEAMPDKRMDFEMAILLTKASNKE